MCLCTFCPSSSICPAEQGSGVEEGAATDSVVEEAVGTETVDEVAACVVLFTVADVGTPPQLARRPVSTRMEKMYSRSFFMFEALNEIEERGEPFLNCSKLIK